MEVFVMKRFIFEILRRCHRVPRQLAFVSYAATEKGQWLHSLMRTAYRTDRLKNVTPPEFERHIKGLPGRKDAAIEGLTDNEFQRDFTIQFEWGHNHDFGTFNMAGTMGDRHVNILAAFLNEFELEARDFAGRKVLDIGCWTGGTSLLLAALGAEVFAIEEVRKYADCVRYLKHAFDIGNLTVESRSLYSLDADEFQDRFDFVLYSGVLYHVTDPVLSLRIVFNSLKDGGRCLLETYATNRPGSHCEYLGAHHTYRQPKQGQPRTGWNWFRPSREAVGRMMMDVGFELQKSTLHEGSRALALGLRARHKDMLRAGLSRPDIR
jgi:2-polyprenyl-3-methyl-5-hydroxy-6-metoxy-1,4-benzoquinol methylase